MYPPTVVVLVLAVAFSKVGFIHENWDVLLLIVNDFRPKLGIYSNPDFPIVTSDVFTPSVDYLASKSLLFERVHCQSTYACNPGRSSELTGGPPRDNALNFI